MTTSEQAEAIVAAYEAEERRLNNLLAHVPYPPGTDVERWNRNWNKSLYGRFFAKDVAQVEHAGMTVTVELCGVQYEDASLVRWVFIDAEAAKIQPHQARELAAALVAAADEINGAPQG